MSEKASGQEQAEVKNKVSFYINGKKYSVDSPDPNLLLVDYLRSTEIGLTGTKHSCGQGGCGACTVMLSRYDECTGKVENVSANSCLRPVVALDGMEITTVEGLGSVNTAVSKTQYAIAKNNGSQCGYCTPGFVMNLHSLLVEKGDEELTKKQIEQSFDGNICRCTGFRPILHGAKTFASDWSPADNKNTPACHIDPAEDVKVDENLKKINPENLNKNPPSLEIQKGNLHWYRPASLVEVLKIMDGVENPESLKLVGGNTSVGIPTIIPVEPTVMIDLSLIKDLKGMEVNDDGIALGASTTYNQLLTLLDKLIPNADSEKLKGLKTLHYMALRTAGKIVRNVASLSGNTMLVTRNVKKGYPFPSDLFMPLAALETSIDVAFLDASGQQGEMRIELMDFVERYNSDEGFAKTAVITKYHIPFTSCGDYIRSYKVALRKENSHSLANASFKISLGDNRVVQKANLLLGGILTKPFHAQHTEEYLLGKKFSNETLKGALAELSIDLDKAFESIPEWVKEIPSEGISDAYKKELAEGYLYKFFVETLNEIAPFEVPEKDKSADYVAFHREESVGSQHFNTYKAEFPVSIPIIKLSAFEQATGEAVYTHDLPVPVKGLQGAFVTARATYANFHYHTPNGDGSFNHGSIDDVLNHVKSKFDGIQDYITYRDIPENGQNDFGKEGVADPLFCENQVSCYGQCIGLLIAENEQIAAKAADYIAEHCISYSSVDDEIILDIREAVMKDSIFPGYTQDKDDNQKIVSKTATDLNWVLKSGKEGLKPGIEYSEADIDGQQCLVVAGTQETGDQIHFYMETQACFTESGEHKEVRVYPSSQSPDTVQGDVAAALGVNSNKVQIDTKRLGGGYGGKTTRTPYVAAPTSIASKKLNTPVRVAMPRENDSYMVGNRHPFLGEYNLAVVPDGPDKGKIVGSVYEFYSNGGNTIDCSFDVMDCAILGSDNCYNVSNFQTEGHVAQTNRSSNGAMRSYGGIQSGLITEEGIEAAAHKIGMLPEKLRELNFYSEGDATPYGQRLNYCLIKEVWDRLKKTSDFESRQKAVEEFNAKNKWKKRGISMIPMKYGLGYNLGFLMQGGAMIDVYAADGSVLVSHGGVEMGQGIMTKIAQVAAKALNVPLELIEMTGTRTSVIANAVGTGATSGTDLNGGAVKKACRIQRKKLEALCMSLLQKNGSEWCEEQGINYWDYKDEGGWKAKVTINSGGESKTTMIWNNVVSQAYQNRIDLSSQALYSTPGLGNSEDQQFYGYTYSAACSEVEIDVLTGESNIIRTDMLYDMGQSLNPAIDIGQIEGAFVMGIGNVLTEKVIWQDKSVPSAPKGKLNTPNTWTYKPPCVATIPLDFRVDLFPRESDDKVPENPNLLMSSKGVGEPPLVLANTVFFAVKHAILAARKDRGLNDWFELPSPATVEEIRKHCNVKIEDLNLQKG